MATLTYEGTTLELVLSQPFYCLGELVTTSSSLGNYIVTVSLHDQSLWLIYDACNPLSLVTEDELEDATGWNTDAYFDKSTAIELGSQKWFRPDYDPCWASFLAFPGGR